MFTIPADFRTALATGSVRLSKAVRIVRSDGLVLACTDADSDKTLPALTVRGLTTPGQLYKAGIGKFPTHIQQSDDPGKFDNWEFQALLGSDVTAADIEGRRYVNAAWTLLIYARENLTWQMRRARGTVGETTLRGQLAIFKMRGLSKKLEAEILQRTSATHTFRWSDAEMSWYNLAGNSADGFASKLTTTVNSVTSRRKFRLNASIGFPAKRFQDGQILFTSGANSGISEDVLSWDNSAGEFVMIRPLPFDIAAGNGVVATIRVPKTREEFVTVVGSATRAPIFPEIPTLENANAIDDTATTTAQPNQGK